MTRVKRHTKLSGPPPRRQRAVGWLALALVIWMTPPVAWSSDHDEAKRLRESGEILPLQQVLRRHRRELGEGVLEVDLQKRRGRYVYEVETLNKRGKVTRHYFDATTGKSLGSRPRN